MSIDFNSLVINKLIIHEVPKKIRGNVQVKSPVLSEIESPLDAELVVFFREKIIISSGSSSAFEIVFDSNTSSPIPTIIQQYFKNEKDFVTTSQEISLHLFSCQTAVNPSGLLTIIECKISEKKALAILKVEKEEGVRVDQSVIDGKNTFNINYIKDLLFTKKTKLFKIGLFYNSTDQKDSISGIVSDHQRGYKATNEVADFFLKNFLGCVLKEDPMITTKRFYEITEEFINVEFTDPVSKSLAHNHLMSELSSEKTMINPDLFAKDYLPVPLRQKFMTTLNEKQVSSNSFQKNLELVESKIKKTALEFESGISVIGTNKAINEKVNLSEMEDGKTKLEFIDKLQKVRSK